MGKKIPCPQADNRTSVCSSLSSLLARADPVDLMTRPGHSTRLLRVSAVHGEARTYPPTWTAATPDGRRQGTVRNRKFCVGLCAEIKSRASAEPLRRMAGLVQVAGHYAMPQPRRWFPATGPAGASGIASASAMAHPCLRRSRRPVLPMRADASRARTARRDHLPGGRKAQIQPAEGAAHLLEA